MALFHCGWQPESSWSSSLTVLGGLAVQMETRGRKQLKRFQQLGSLPDLEEENLNLSMAVMLTDDGHPDKPMYFLNCILPNKLTLTALVTCPILRMPS
jgi:hypothetical protein